MGYPNRVVEKNIGAMRRAFRQLLAIAILAPCFLPRTSAASETLAATAAELRALAVPERDLNSVPEAAVALLSGLKRGIANAVSEIVLDQRSVVAATVLQQALDALARQLDPDLRAGRGEEPVSDHYKSLYGHINTIQAVQPKDAPGVLAVVTTLSVACGSDAVLQLFTFRHDRWQESLRVDAGGYPTVASALGRFQFGVSPHRAGQPFYVVAANVNPWCTSNWQALRYRAFEVRPDGHARELASDSRTIYIAVDDPVFTLSVDHEGFTLKFAGEGNPDSGSVPKRLRKSFVTQGPARVGSSP